MPEYEYIIKLVKGYYVNENNTVPLKSNMCLNELKKELDNLKFIDANGLLINTAMVFVVANSSDVKI
jgi:hypothetical protein